MSTFLIRISPEAPQSHRVQRRPRTGTLKPPGPAARQQLAAAVRYLDLALGHLGGAARRVDERHPEGAALAARADAAEILIAQALGTLR